ncbi:D-ribitol-5-phosphate cytidylyltransferase-like [Mya arenaria]|uniref:D-ribitol-5-phosphate cytidylyltransferase-like n=1 Tax=Mya arenaria TaxID=6604 RepID=UPI0022E4D696|nr:D-ribitol-5-phosphate cytidylyltransferase-like [Mya arenaria]
MLSADGVKMRVSVVLPASGTGDRFGTCVPKQFSPLLNQPLLLHTLNAFHRLEWVGHVVMVVSDDALEELTSQLKEWPKLTLVCGHSTRHRSIQAGIRALAEDGRPPDAVIIHDVVRPFVEEELIKQVTLDAIRYGAAGVARPLVSTVIKVDGEGMLTEALDRSQYRASEMPQAFTYSVIKEAYDKADATDLDYGTECLLLALKHTGTRARVVPGPDYLWKVTYKKDLYAVEGIMKEQLLCAAVRFSDGGEDLELLDAISTCCQLRSVTVLRNNDQQAKCNSWVFICKSGPADMDTGLADVCNHVTAKDGETQFVKPCVICVLRVNCEDTERHFKNLISNQSEKHPSSVWYGIVSRRKVSDAEKIGKMVASLLWTREETLTGQTFTIH